MFSAIKKLFVGAVVAFFRFTGMPKETLADAAGHLRWLGRFLAEVKGRLIFLVFLTPINAVITFSMPVVIEWIVSDMKKAVETGILPDYTVSIPLLFATGACSVLTYILLQRTRAYVNMRIEWRVRTTVFNRLTFMGHGFFTKFRTGDVITRFTDDLDKVSWFSCSQIFRTYEAALYVIAGTIYMLTRDPLLTLFAVVPMPLFALVVGKTDARLWEMYDRLQKLISRVNNTLEVCFSGIRILRTYRREDQQASAFERVASDRKATEIEVASKSVLVESAYRMIPGVVMVVVLIVGGLRVIKDPSPERLGAFVGIIYAYMMVMPRVFELGWLLIAARKALVSIGRIRELEEQQPDVREQMSPRTDVKFDDCIEFRNVGFKYNGSEQWAVKGANFKIRKGRTVAFVGPVGAGKSTLAGLIPRLTDATEGEITIDGVNIKEFSLLSLRRHIGYVSQEPLLFSGTIEANVIFGRPEISKEDVEWACRVSQFSNDMKAFSDGMATLVGHRGMTLSGGQKQRLSLARALAGRPEILILDDCSSALDAQTEAMMWNALSEDLSEMTVVVISHRIASVRNADSIIVLENGNQSSCGTHEELLASGNRVYRDLYDAQMGD